MNMYAEKTKLLRGIENYKLGIKLQEKLRKERKMTSEQKLKLKEMIEAFNDDFSY